MNYFYMEEHFLSTLFLKSLEKFSQNHEKIKEGLHICHFTCEYLPSKITIITRSENLQNVLKKQDIC